MSNESALILHTRAQISAAQDLARYHALRLELLGLTRHGRSAYAIIKEVYNLSGSRKSVLAQYKRYLEEKGVLRG